MNIKNVSIISVALIILMVAVSCATTAKQPSSDVSYRDFKKVSENLYEITFDSYNTDYGLFTPEEAIGKFACSAVRNGNYYGRSFDFIYSDSFELVVHTPSAKGRYASVAMSGTQSKENIDVIEKHSDEDLLNQMAIVLCDGINEKGVVCNINVIPVEDLECPTTGTNPGKPDLNLNCIIRFILDNASSAKQAVRLLQNRNVYIPRDFYHISDMGYELHVMIADKKDTFVVEFINNEMKVVKDAKIMTNYYLSLDDYTPHSSGIERYNILKENYDKGNSVEGMAKLMQMVQYTNGYGKPYFYSDIFGFTESGLDININTYEQYKSVIDPALDSLKNNYRTWMNQGINPEGFWITMHMTVFDIENKTMRVTVQERYNEPYFFNL